LAAFRYSLSVLKIYNSRYVHYRFSVNGTGSEYRNTVFEGASNILVHIARTCW